LEYQIEIELQVAVDDAKEEMELNKKSIKEVNKIKSLRRNGLSK